MGTHELELRQSLLAHYRSFVVTIMLHDLLIFGFLSPSPSAIHKGAYGAVVICISEASTLSTVESDVFTM